MAKRSAGLDLPLQFLRGPALPDRRQNIELAASGSELDVVLVDVRLADGSGLDLLPGARGGKPAYVVISTFDRPQYAVTAFRLWFMRRARPAPQIAGIIWTDSPGPMWASGSRATSWSQAAALSHDQAAVNVEYLAGNERGVFAHQKQNRARHVLRRGHATERNPG